MTDCVSWTHEERVFVHLKIIDLKRKIKLLLKYFKFNFLGCRQYVSVYNKTNPNRIKNVSTMMQKPLTYPERSKLNSGNLFR